MPFCGFVPSFIPNNAIAGQTYQVIELFRILGLKPSDIDVLYMNFMKCHPDDTGSVKILNILSTNDMIETPFLCALFHVHGTTPILAGEVTFEVWVITLYNLLTLDEDDITSFLFFIFDMRGQQLFSKQEIHYIFKCIWGESRYSTDKFIITNIERMPFNRKDEITTDAIIQFIDDTPILMLPIYQAQDIFRKKIKHESFWNRITRNRNKIHKNKIIFDICNAYINDTSILDFFDVLNIHAEMPKSLQLKLSSLKQLDEEKKRYMRSNRQRKSTIAPKEKSSQASNQPHRKYLRARQLQEVALQAAAHEAKSNGGSLVVQLSRAVNRISKPTRRGSVSVNPDSQSDQAGSIEQAVSSLQGFKAPISQTHNDTMSSIKSSVVIGRMRSRSITSSNKNVGTVETPRSATLNALISPRGHVTNADRSSSSIQKINSTPNQIQPLSPGSRSSLRSRQVIPMNIPSDNSSNSLTSGLPSARESSSIHAFNSFKSNVSTNSISSVHEFVISPRRATVDMSASFSNRPRGKASSFIENNYNSKKGKLSSSTSSTETTFGSDASKSRYGRPSDAALAYAATRMTNSQNP